MAAFLILAFLVAAFLALLALAFDFAFAIAAASVSGVMAAEFSDPGVDSTVPDPSTIN